MKAWVLHGIGDIRYEEVLDAAPGRGEVRIRVRSAGVCGSDIPRIFTTGAHNHPLIPGHEFSGTVDLVGEGVDARWLGKRAGAFPLLYCGSCRYCRRGLTQLCGSYGFLGSRQDGAYAEYVRVPERNLVELPEGVSFEEGAMLEPMSVAVHALRQAGLLKEDGDDREKAVAVCGLGTIGLLAVLILLDAGYSNIYVIGNKDSQRRRAEDMGVPAERFCNSREEEVSEWVISRTGEGADVFLECVGSAASYGYSLDSTAPLGTVVLTGNPPSDMGLSRQTYWKILRKELNVRGTWNSSFKGAEDGDWGYALKALKRGRIAPGRLITHRIPLEGLYDALLMMRDKKEDYCKVMAEI